MASIARFKANDTQQSHRPVGCLVRFTPHQGTSADNADIVYFRPPSVAHHACACRRQAPRLGTTVIEP